MSTWRLVPEARRRPTARAPRPTSAADPGREAAARAVRMVQAGTGTGTAIPVKSGIPTAVLHQEERVPAVRVDEGGGCGRDHDAGGAGGVGAGVHRRAHRRARHECPGVDPGRRRGDRRGRRRRPGAGRARGARRRHPDRPAGAGPDLRPETHRRPEQPDQRGRGRLPGQAHRRPAALRPAGGRRGHRLRVRTGPSSPCRRRTARSSTTPSTRSGDCRPVPRARSPAATS